MPGGRGTPESIADALNEVADEQVELVGEMIIMALDFNRYEAELSVVSMARGIARCADQLRRDQYRHVLCHAMEKGQDNWNY